MERCSYTSAVLTDDNSTITADEEMEPIGILSTDPGLEQHKDHFKYRVGRYLNQLNLFDKHEGGLEEFARGDFYFLFFRMIKRKFFMYLGCKNNYFQIVSFL